MLSMKISVIGSGNVGGIVSLLAMQRNLGDVILFDVFDGAAKGKALDLSQMAALLNEDVCLKGVSSYVDIGGSDVCIITAGIPRLFGKSRKDLLQSNLKVIKQVALGIQEHAPNAFCIVVTNPVNIMSYIFYKLSKIPKTHVVGMAGVLDSTRFRVLLSEELGISVQDINTLVLGDHSDSMIPLVNFSNVGGISLTKLISMGILDKKRLDLIIEKVKNGGTDIVNLMKNGSAFYAPALSIIEILESFLNRNKRRILPCSVYLEGEYGIRDVFLGVPVLIGKNGIEEILRLPLEAEEEKCLLNSAEMIKDVIMQEYYK